MDKITIALTDAQWNNLEIIMNDAFMTYDLASERESANPRIAEMRETTRELFNDMDSQRRQQL